MAAAETTVFVEYVAVPLESDIIVYFDHVTVFDAKLP